MDRLQPLDAVFVDAEDQDKNTSMAIASIAVFQGPAPAQEEILAWIADRLPAVPRYRQKLRTVPLRLGRPVWVDDPDFDLGYHVRRVALPEPGEYRQLTDLMARVMSERLDREHPLWEDWVVEGLARDRWALISKVHHCMIDGIGGADLYRVIMAPPAGAARPPENLPPENPPTEDARPAGALPENLRPKNLPAEDPQAGDQPSAIALAAQATAEMMRLPVRWARVLSGAVSDPGRAISQAAGAARAVARFSGAMRPAPSSSLSGSIGRQRRYAWTRASLEDVKTIKREFGGTVNDVLLAAISGGFRALLLERGEQPQPHEVPSLVPVSVRAPGDHGGFGNEVSATITDLPVHVADPVERLATVRATQDLLKADHEALIGQALVTLGRYDAYPLTSWIVRKFFGLPQREIVTVTTNVPGPREAIYWMGRRLEEIIPYVPIASTVRTGISIFSYDGELTFGITADYDANPDLEVLARGIEHGVAELLLAAREHAMATAG
jgi:diacylglycerol O-acyltransferase / wax synthase